MEQKNNSVLLKAIYSYLLTIVISIIISPLFSLFYDKILEPPTAGYGLFFGRQDELAVGGIIFAYISILPFFVMILLNKRQWLIWLIGIIIPAIIIFSEGKYIFWFIIFTVAGAVLGWLIKLGVKKLKKAS